MPLGKYIPFESMVFVQTSMESLFEQVEVWLSQVLLLLEHTLEYKLELYFDTTVDDCIKIW